MYYYILESNVLKRFTVVSGYCFQINILQFYNDTDTDTNTNNKTHLHCFRFSNHNAVKD